MLLRAIVFAVGVSDWLFSSRLPIKLPVNCKLVDCKSFLGIKAIQAPIVTRFLWFYVRYDGKWMKRQEIGSIARKRTRRSTVPARNCRKFPWKICKTFRSHNSVDLFLRCWSIASGTMSQFGGVANGKLAIDTEHLFYKLVKQSTNISLVLINSCMKTATSNLPSTDFTLYFQYFIYNDYFSFSNV